MIRTLTLCFALTAAATAGKTLATTVDDYHKDWTPGTFIQRVNECREAIVTERAQEFEKRTLENTEDEQFAHNEGIRATSMVDEVASQICFCRYNEFAKNNAPDTEMSNEIREKIESEKQCGAFEERFKERVKDSYDMEQLMLD